MKSSFILHLDSLCVLDKMTDQQAGMLFKAIYDYHKTGSVREDDVLLTLTLTPFVNQFVRDEEKYRTVVERNRTNGANGGRPPFRGKKPKKPSGLNKTQWGPKNPEEPKKPDSDSDNDSDSDLLFSAFWDKYKKKRDKAPAEKSWKKLSKVEQQKAIDYIPIYFQGNTEYQYQKYPATYLNSKCWEDEIPKPPAELKRIDMDEYLRRPPVKSVFAK